MPKKIKVVDLKPDFNQPDSPRVDDYQGIVEKVDAKPSEQPSTPEVEPQGKVAEVSKKARAPRPKRKTDAPVAVEEPPAAVEEPPAVVEVPPAVVAEQPPPVVAEQPPPVVEEVLPSPPEVQDAIPDEKEEKKNVKTVELVECPKSGKKLTQRTLKYSHAAKCPKNEKPQPVRQEEVAQPPSAHTLRLQKIKERQEKFKNLAVHAF